MQTTIKTTIIQQLEQLEAHHNIKVLYACETGSRAWGFPSPDSDYDVRIIYRHEPDWYLSLSEKKDTIEIMDGDLDITGWDIRKCLRLMWKSNGALLERVQSPIVYREEQNISVLLREYAAKCFSPVATMHHYLGLAHNTFADVDQLKEVKLKKLFYALRATLACKWIVEKDGIPPIVFQTMLDELTINESLKYRITELVNLKAHQSEGYLHPAETALNDFIRNELKTASEVAGTLGGRKEHETDLDELFRRILKYY